MREEGTPICYFGILEIVKSPFSRRVIWTVVGFHLFPVDFSPCALRAVVGLLDHRMLKRRTVGR